jgi:hypothetical protein
VLFSLFVDETLGEAGLSGSYVNGSLRATDEEDWRVSQAIAGTRVDQQLFFPTSSLGDRATVGVGGGTDEDWDQFSVQWDGIITVPEEGIRLSTRSEGGSRMWIDRNRDGSLNKIAELVDNNWGQGTRHADEQAVSLAPGSYRIRIQYEDDDGPNTFSLIANKIPRIGDGRIKLFTNPTLTEPGIVGSYFDQNLRTVDQLDWRASQVLAGTLIDERLDFEDPSWGIRQEVGLTRGSDADWTDFSVQWDGVVQVLEPGTRLATRSDDGSRMWIDIDGNGVFDPVTELVNNHWGTPQATTTGDPSTPLDPGVYSIRIQYEEEFFGNVMQLVALPPPQVRVAYVVPSNRVPQVAGVDALEAFLPRMKQWYAEQMDRLGFGAQTFRYETTSDGFTPLVHVVHVGVTDDFLREDVWGHTQDAAAASGVPLWSEGEIWLLVPESHIQDPDGSIRGGVALGAGFGSGRGAGVAMLGADSLFRLTADQLWNDQAYAGVIQPELGPLPLVQDVSFPWFEGQTFSSVASSIQGALVHEVSHAFGLGHDFRNDGNYHGNLMGNGLRGLRGAIHPELYPQDDMRLSYAAALALSVSPYFNDITGSDSELPAVSITTSGAVDLVDGLLEIEFAASDDQQLAVALLRRNGDTVGEMVLTGQSTATSFATPSYEPGQSETFEVSVYDTSGNRRNETVQITVTPGQNRAPQPLVKALHSQAIAGQAVTLDATSSNDPDHDNAMLQVEWDLDGDGIFDTPPTNTKTFTTVFAEPGVRLVSARLTDPSGAQSVSTPVALRILTGKDFGDAPTAEQSGFLNSYPTNISQNGARHAIGELFLGEQVDTESDGQPDSAAGTSGSAGDDNRGERDEDGVVFITSMVATNAVETASSVAVVASQAGFVDGWVDFTRDGDWDDVGEQILKRVAVEPGVNLLPYRIPTDARSGETATRFRISSTGGLSPRGPSFDGQVEDYLVTIVDGDASGGATATVAAPSSDELDVVSEGNDVVVQMGTLELLRVPGNKIRRLEIFGGPGDEVINVANLDAIFSGRVGVDAGGGNDTLQLIGSDQHLDLTQTPSIAIQGLEKIDITGSGNNTLKLDAGAVLNVSSLSGTLDVVSNPGDTVSLESGWELAGTMVEDGELVRILTQGGAALRLTGPFAWSYPQNPLDANASGSVDPIDALIIINELNSPQFSDRVSGRLVDATRVAAFPNRFYDVLPDGFAVASDALVIINFLNSAGAPQGEDAQFAFDLGLSGLVDRQPLENDSWQPQQSRLKSTSVDPIIGHGLVWQANNAISHELARLRAPSEKQSRLEALEHVLSDFTCDDLFDALSP